MPNKQNAKKALRRSIKRAERNVVVKLTYKKALKKARKAVATGTATAAEEIRMAQKTLDKAAKRGVLKKNTAARTLSRLMKRAAASNKK